MTNKSVNESVDKAADNLIQLENRSANRLLAALPAADYQRLAPYLEPVLFSPRQMIYAMDEPIEAVYFPEQGMVSLLTAMQDGAMVEVGVVGDEGVIGASAVLGDDISPFQAIVQIAGTGVKLRLSQLKAELEQNRVLQQLLLRYMQVLYIQASQNAACNRLHCLEARLARWLLTVHDRVHSSEFLLTQESMAQMLGARRAGVTVAAQGLQQAGLIRYSRGNITILNRSSLEAVSCECYGRIKAQFQRLLD